VNEGSGARRRELAALHIFAATRFPTSLAERGQQQSRSIMSPASDTLFAVLARWFVAASSTARAQSQPWPRSGRKIDGNDE